MPKLNLLTIILFLSISLVKCNDQNQIITEDDSFTGKVTAITDGDTFKLLLKDSTLIRVRIANIDCPERKQPFSKKAKQFTADAIFNKEVALDVQTKDRYGRSIAEVFYDDNKNLGQELVKAGLAWNFVKYSKDKSLDSLQLEAKERKLGFWSDPNAMPPWEWRSHKKKKN